MSFDPLKSRTINRAFLEFKPGTSTYNAEPLHLFCPLEFGPDWDSPTKHRPPVRKRFYDIVTSLTPSGVTLQSASSAAEAIRLASKLRHTHRQALLEELQRLRSRILELETEILAP